MKKTDGCGPSVFPTDIHQSEGLFEDGVCAPFLVQLYNNLKMLKTYE